LQRGIAALMQSAKPSNTFERADSILVPFARKPAPGRVDEHSARLLIASDFGRFLILDNGDRQIKSPSQYPCTVRNWDLQRLHARASAAFTFPELLKDARRESAVLRHAIRQGFGQDVAPGALELAHRCAAFDHGLALSRAVLRNTAAKRIFIVGRNSTPELLGAAAEAGVPSIELQHGVIAKFNPHYHYPGRPRVPYAPDWLLTFGPMWQQEINLPAQTRPSVIGFPNFPQSRAASSPKCLLVLSQWSIGPRLIDAVRSVAKAAADWDIVFRPHPLENAMAYKKIFSDCPNVRISNDELLEVQFSGASVQLGVYSTALYEGMSAGLRTILLDLPGIEHMDTCLQRGDAVLSHRSEDVASLLATAPRAKDVAFYIEPAAAIAAALGIA